MATQPYRWRGPKELTRSDPTWDWSADKLEVRMTFEGPYALCVRERPKIGSALARFMYFR